MVLPTTLRFRQTAGRWLVVALMLFSLAVGATGLPLPYEAAKDTSIPFPCMHRRCGCRDAATCWQSCCCNTNAQKIAWAKKHDVAVPAFVARAAERESMVEKASRSCCEGKAIVQSKPNGRGTTKANSPAGGCCKSKQLVRAKHTATLQFEDAGRCMGQYELWLMLSQVAPPEPKIAIMVDERATEWLAVASTTGELISSHPGERPPKSLLF
jgi:hypothetical protein